LSLRISSSRRWVSAAQSGSSFGSGPTCAMRASYHSANCSCSQVDSFSKAVAISVAVLRSKTMERLTPTATQPLATPGLRYSDPASGVVRVGCEHRTPGLSAVSNVGRSARAPGGKRPQQGAAGRDGRHSCLPKGELLDRGQKCPRPPRLPPARPVSPSGEIPGSAPAEPPAEPLTAPRGPG
jgi:hypothetical protein